MVSNISTTEIQLKDVLLLLWHKKRLIILVSGLCALMGFFYASYTPQLYTTSVRLMPPLSSSVTPLNETDLKLFTAENIFEIFTTILKSDDSKYSYFKKNILPILPVNSDIADNYKAFSKALKIELAPGSNNYIISFTTENPLSVSMEIMKFIDYVNQHALYEVIKTSKKAHENKALLIQRNIDYLKETARNKVKNQLAILEEALYIAESSGIEKPLKSNKRLDGFGANSMYLYYNGSKPLKALIHNLSKRADYDAFIPNLDALKTEYNFYKKYQMTSHKNILYHLDGIKVPPTLISFSKVQMTITSLLLSLLLVSIIVFVYDGIFKNTESHMKNSTMD